MRMLVVDDTEVARIVLKGLMARYGQCDEARDGLEAVECFKTGLSEGRPYDLIFMDIMMPNMNGIDALAEIRKVEAEAGRDGQTKVIMVTALSEPQIVIEAYYRGGANSYITKPIEKSVLLREMERLGCPLQAHRPCNGQDKEGRGAD